MHFGIVISVAMLTIGSQATPQFRSLIGLGGLLDGARNQARTSFFQFGNPLQRNDNMNRRNNHFQSFSDDQTITRQSHRPNNFEQQQQQQQPQQQISQNDAQLWNQCLNLFANHPMNLENRNQIHTVSVLPSHPNGNWEEQYSSNPTGSLPQDRPRRPPPPGFHHPGPMPHNNRRPGPPPQHHRPQNVNEPGLEICQEPAANVSPQSSTETLPTSSTTTETIVEKKASSEDLTTSTVQDSVTTEFDWNNYYPEGASVNNPGGSGMLDVRGDFN